MACSVQLVSDYDEQIDTSLTQLNTDLTTFVVKMTAAAGTPQGTYDANKDFYVTEEAKVQTIKVRAEAHQVLNSCPSTDLIKSALAHSGANAAQYEGQIPQGDCGVVLISLIEKGFEDLETFHREQGSKGIPKSSQGPILVGGVGSLIKSAIIVEIAQKGNKTPGAS
jgi:hypothetical protein